MFKSSIASLTRNKDGTISSCTTDTERYDTERINYTHKLRVANLSLPQKIKQKINDIRTKKKPMNIRNREEKPHQSPQRQFDENKESAIENTCGTVRACAKIASVLTCVNLKYNIYTTHEQSKMYHKLFHLAPGIL